MSSNRPNFDFQARNWRNSTPRKDDKVSASSNSSKSIGAKKVMGNKGPTKTAQKANKPRNLDIKCFKCQDFGHIAFRYPNQWIMIMLSNGEVLADEEDGNNESNYEGMPFLIEEEDEEESKKVPTRTVGVTMVARLALTTQASQEELQRENIFYTRCQVQDKVCSLMIDPRNFKNIASALMV